MESLSELKAQIEFDREDVERLQVLESLVSSNLDRIVESYRTGLPEDIGYEWNTSDLQLWDDVKCWLQGIFTTSYSPSYCESRLERERGYLDAGLEPHVLLLSLHLLRCELIELIFANEGVETTPEIFKSLERVLTLEWAIVLQACRDSLQVDSLETIPALADGLAHEIRNPLNTIGLQLTILDRRLESSVHSNEEYRTVLETVRCELDRLEEICSNLHHMALSAELERRWYDVQTIFDAIISSFELEHRDASLTLRASKDGDDVYCDAEYVRRGIRFLIESTEEAVEGEHMLHLEFSYNEEYAIFELSEDESSDNECHCADRRNIFDWIQPSSGSWRGVGLSVAEEVARSHGGSLERMTSPEDKRDRIRLLLPRPEL